MSDRPSVEAASASWPWAKAGGRSPRPSLGDWRRRGSDDDEMYALMHEMRSRIIQSPSFDGESIIGAILFEDTMDRRIDGRDSVSYLWQVTNAWSPS